MLTTLPSELLLQIVGSLVHDLQALQSVAPLSHRLLPIVRQELFRVMNIRALEHEYMGPYLCLVRELRAGPRFKTRPDLLDRRFLHKLNGRTLPELRALSLHGIDFSRTTRVYKEDWDALGALASVTELSLSRVIFYDEFDMMTLIRAFPNLAALSLDCVEVPPDSEMLDRSSHHAPIALDRANAGRELHTMTEPRPRLSKLSLDWGFMVLQALWWLAWHEPGRMPLSTLTIAPSAIGADLIILQFGPTVVRLATPLRPYILRDRTFSLSYRIIPKLT